MQAISQESPMDRNSPDRAHLETRRKPQLPRIDFPSQLFLYKYLSFDYHG